MDLEEVLRHIFPCWLFDYFDFIKMEETEEQMHVYFDEKKIIPLPYRNQPICSHGFTESYTVRDFPIRGKEVYLHFRRRKWLLLNSNKIVSFQYDIAYDGTKLTKEFVSFLKDED